MRDSVRTRGIILSAFLTGIQIKDMYILTELWQQVVHCQMHLLETMDLLRLGAETMLMIYLSTAQSTKLLSTTGLYLLKKSRRICIRDWRAMSPIWWDTGTLTKEKGRLHMTSPATAIMGSWVQHRIPMPVTRCGWIPMRR